MKILIITPYFYPSVGGVQNYVLSTARRLTEDHGHQVIIATSGTKECSIKQDKFEGMTIYRLPYQLKLSNTPISFMWARQIKGIISKEEPDVINVHTPVPFIADIAVRAAGSIPTVLTYHNDLAKDNFAGNLLAKAFYALFSKATLRMSDRIITTSQYYADNSPYLKPWVSKISIVSPGVDLERFNTKIDRSWLKKQYPGKKIILFVGSMEKTHTHKGVDTLINAVANVLPTMPDLHLVIAGKGSAIPDYAALAKSLGLTKHVSFPGFVSDDDLPRYYAGADVFVLPSTNESEGFGMVLAEAQACGTPVIGSRVGGIPRVIDDQSTGILVEPKNIAHLSKALIFILSSKHRANAIATQGAKRARADFSWKAQSDVLSEIFQEMAA